VNNRNDSENSIPSLSEEPVPSPIDAVIHLLISDNKLETYLNMEPPMNGGASPTIKNLENEIARCKIVFGIDTNKLKEISETPQYNHNIVVAKGVKAINGIDGTYAFQFNPKKELKPKEKSDGKVDYYDLGIVENVAKGQILCKITLPTNGTDGMSVTGVKLLAVRGKAVPSFLGKNTELNKEGTAICAAKKGHVEYSNGKINVSEIFIVEENVDNSTGNIKFNGNILVKGMVLPGFTIESDGNMEIRGRVETAKLKAGGNIILHSGIIGSELICAGDLTSRFIENCNLTIKGSAKSEYIMNSNLRCGKSFKVFGMYARISGGSCIVGEDLTAPCIGSETGTKTDLELGTDPSIIERQHEIKKQIPELEKQINSLTQLISLLRQYEAANRLTAEKKVVLDNALFNYETTMALLEKEKQESEEIDESLKTKGYGKIICSGTIHPGTRIKIGCARMVVSDPITCRSLYHKEGEIWQGSIY